MNKRDDINEIRDCWNNGVKAETIAAAFGLSPKRLYNMAYRYGWSRRRAKRLGPRAAKARNDMIVELRSHGMKAVDIAAALGVTNAVVWQVTHRARITRLTSDPRVGRVHTRLVIPKPSLWQRLFGRIAA